MSDGGHRGLRLLFAARSIMLLGSLGAFVGALLMFWVGGLHLLEALHVLVAPAGDVTKSVTIYVLEATDSFLFGIVLVIFAYGIAVGFVFRLPDDVAARLPRWMKVEGVGQLKLVLSEVVLVILVVIFARLVVEADGVFVWTMLVLPLSILLIAVGIRFLGMGGDHGGERDGAH